MMLKRIRFSGRWGTIFEVLSLGFYSPPFDRKAYASSVFPLRDVAFSESDPVARVLKSMMVRQAVDNAENSYNCRVANRRAFMVAIISILMLIINAVIGVWAVTVEHGDSVSTTKALVEAIYKTAGR